MNDYSVICAQQQEVREDENFGPILEHVGQLETLLARIEEQLLERNLADARKTLDEINDRAAEIDIAIADAEAAEEEQRRADEEGQRDSAILSYAFEIADSRTDISDAAAVAAFFLRHCGREQVGELVKEVLEQVKRINTATSERRK